MPTNRHQRLRFFLFLLTIFLFTYRSPGQRIDYAIPKEYEKQIDKKDYRKIVDAAVAVIAQRYQIDFVRKGTIQLKGGQDMQAFNLDNLILKCAGTPDKSQWESVVKEHFQNLFAAVDEQKKINPADFESIRKYLTLRIYAQEYLTQRGGTAGFVVRNDLQGTSTMLMLDLPGAFVPVEKAVFDGWQKTQSEVFGIAQSNVNGQKIGKVTRTFPVNPGEIEITFLGNEDYAASYALDLAGNAPELVREWGAVVIMPNKRLVNICKVSPVRPLNFVKFIQYTREAVGRFYAQHAQPISDQYFWYCGGKFTRINVLTDPEGKVNVVAPVALGMLMSEKK
jgi:hypothetical protein